MDTFRLFPRQASALAPQVDLFYFFLIAVTTFFTVLIFILIVFFALYYRRRNANERPPHIHTNYTLEITWTVIPLLITMVIFVWGAKLYFRGQQPPANATEIFVIGKRWMWKIQHQEGRREINELHVPLGQPIKLTMTSQDVIHDFGIPDFRVKEDVRPGSYSTEWFIPTELGEFHLYCDQYCGAKHGDMIGKVVVMKPEQYAAWLAGADEGEQPRVAGEKLFVAYGCAGCHGQRAPSLAGVYGRPVDVIDDAGNRRTVQADENYLLESILYPNKKIVVGYGNIMPSFKGTVSEEQLVDLLAYIKSLAGAADSDKYNGPPTGPATQPTNQLPPIVDPPAASYRANQ